VENRVERPERRRGLQAAGRPRGAAARSPWVTTLFAVRHRQSRAVQCLQRFVSFEGRRCLRSMSAGKPMPTRIPGRNILANEEYVVHIADRPLMEPLHLSSTEHAPDVSEVGGARSRDPAEALRRVRAAGGWRVAPIAMEWPPWRTCMEFRRGPQSADRRRSGDVPYPPTASCANGKIDAKDPRSDSAGPGRAQLCGARRHRHDAVRPCDPGKLDAPPPRALHRHDDLSLPFDPMPRPPNVALPHNCCDSQFHVFGPAGEVSGRPGGGLRRCPRRTHCCRF